MAAQIALVEITVAATVVVFAFKSLWRRGLSAAWWTGVGAATVAGAALGGWLGFYCTYKPEPGVEVFSFPTPAAFFVLETYGDGSEQWVDFITPAPMLVATANACLIFSLAIAAVWLLQRLAGRVAGVAAKRSPR